jgi:hypothetical protein
MKIDSNNEELEKLECFILYDINYLTRLKSKSNVREKRGDGDGGVRLTSFSNSVRRRMWIKEEK